MTRCFRPTVCNSVVVAEQRGTAIEQRRCRPYEARWLFAPLLGAFAVALALTAVSHVVAFFVWAAGSLVTIGIGRWYEAEFERTHPRAALPSATSLPPRDRSRR